MHTAQKRRNRAHAIKGVPQPQRRYDYAAQSAANRTYGGYGSGGGHKKEPAKQALFQG